MDSSACCTLCCFPRADAEIDHESHRVVVVGADQRYLDCVLVDRSDDEIGARPEVSDQHLAHLRVAQPQGRHKLRRQARHDVVSAEPVEPVAQVAKGSQQPHADPFRRLLGPIVAARSRDVFA